MPSKLDEWSLRSVPLRILCNDACLGEATGFFWTENGETFLITNWHVVAGRHPDTGEPLSYFAPEELEYPRFIQGESYTEVWRQKIRLRDENCAATWFVHPVYSNSVDVTAIPVPLHLMVETSKGPQNSYVCPIDKTSYSGEWTGRRLDMGSDLFVLGFPMGLKPTGHFPIWKRASVATEMEILLNGRPAFLIDTATREGMSGSPVVYVRNSDITGYGGSRPHRHVEFVGVYSGRHVGRNEIQAQLGIVWKPEIIRDILACRTPGSQD
jgi:hypothetical protein